MAIFNGVEKVFSRLAKAPSILTKIVSDDPSSVKDLNSHRTKDRSISRTIEGVVFAKDPSVS
jgi:hypothetical protein